MFSFEMAIMRSSILFIVTFAIFSLFGISFAIIKQLSGQVDPCALTGIRMLVAGACGLVLSLYFNRNKVYSLRRKVLLKILCCGIFGHLLSNVLELIAIGHVDMVIGTTIYGLTPVVTGILSNLITKDKTSWRSGLYVVLASLGLVISSGAGISARSSSYAPIVTMFFAMLTSCYTWIQTRDLEHVEKMSYATVSSASMFVAGIFGVGCSWYFNTLWGAINNLVFGKNFYLFLTLMFCSNFLATFLYGKLLSQISAVSVSMLGSVSFPINALLGIFLFKEIILAAHVLGYILVMLGVVGYVGENKRIKRGEI